MSLVVTDDGDSVDTTETPGFLIIERLSKEPFNIKAATRLLHHPFAVAASAGALTLAQRRAFALEHYAMNVSFAISAASLAGHSGFHPNRLVGVEEPDKPGFDMYQLLLQSCFHVGPILLAYAEKLGLDEAALRNHKASALAQGYAAYWGSLAVGGRRAAGAAACAMIYPACCKLWDRLFRALADPANRYGYDGPDDVALAYVKFFSTPMDDIEAMAADIIDEEGATYDDVVEHVRLLLEYHLISLDAIYYAK